VPCRRQGVAGEHQGSPEEASGRVTGNRGNWNEVFDGEMARLQRGGGAPTTGKLRWSAMRSQGSCSWRRGRRNVR
jgi:hypothetical protein